MKTVKPMKTMKSMKTVKSIMRSRGGSRRVAGLGGLAAVALACVPLGSAPVAQAASAQAASQTYVDPSQTYSLSYPASWTRTSTRPFDLFVRSADGNITLATSSAVMANPGARHIRQDLPGFVKAFGTPLGAPKYTTYRRQGVPLYFGLSAYTTAQGKIGVAMVEEIYGHQRLCLAAGVVRDATVPSAKTDLTTAVTVLTSLTLSTPSNSLDQPSG